MKKRFIVTTLWIICLTSLSLVVAQGTCPQIVEQALQSLGDNCDDLSRNAACYGYNLVTAEFSETVAEDFFTQPADTSELGILESIQTAEMDTDLSQWGIALMSVQANVPNSIPGQAVRFVLLGDVEVESAVEPDGTFESIDPIDVTLTDSANIRSGAGLSFNVIGGVEVGVTVPVDGQNTDGTWYRTIFNERVGWIFADLIEGDDNLDNLPVIDGQQRSPMQSFYLRTGVGTPQCDEAPSDTLVVQGPENIEIDLTVNGADVRLGSTVAMRILPPGNVIEFTVIDGSLTIIGGGANGEDLVVFENYRTTACLADPDNLGVDGNSNDRIVACEFTEPEFVPELDLGDAFCVLEDVPERLFNYGVDLECPVETEFVFSEDTPPQPSATPQQDNNLCYEGNAWGDGRCQTDYDWEAGFYYGQLEAGEIDLVDIPAPFYVTPTPRPTASPNDDDDDSDSGIDAEADCAGPMTFGVVVNDGPPGDTSFIVTYTDGGVPQSTSTFSIPDTVTFGASSTTVTDIRVSTFPSDTNVNLGDLTCP